MNTPTKTARQTAAEYVTLCNGLAGASARHHGDFTDDLEGRAGFAVNKEQALLIAKTIKETADRLAKPK